MHHPMENLHPSLQMRLDPPVREDKIIMKLLQSCLLFLFFGNQFMISRNLKTHSLVKINSTG
jgi:hypothetical protein